MEFSKDVEERNYGAVRYLDLKYAPETNHTRIPRLDQLPRFQAEVAKMSKDLQELMDKTSMERAHFLYQYSLETSWKFLSTIRTIFKRRGGSGLRLEANLKTNLRRIAIKIDEYDKAEEANPRDPLPGLGKFNVTDMIRASVRVA